jgi:hypothetical protein
VGQHLTLTFTDAHDFELEDQLEGCVRNYGEIVDTVENSEMVVIGDIGAKCP